MHAACMYLVSSLVPRLFFLEGSDGEKRAWYPLSANAQDFQKRNLDIYHSSDCGLLESQFVSCFVTSWALTYPEDLFSVS